MTRYCLIFIFSLISLSAAEPVLFQLEKSKAHSFLEKNKIIISKISKEFHFNAHEILAIVFPELLRYNRYRDFLECTLLEQWYIKGGTSLADFSIGPFQMKPSFIEMLEEHVGAHTTLYHRFGFITFYASVNKKNIRKERLKRLQSLEWQLRYAFCYYAVITDCYNQLNLTDRADQIRFFATAYNFGFDQPFEKIQNWMTVEAFPFGKQIQTQQESYGAIAVQFFNKNPMIFNCEP